MSITRLRHPLGATALAPLYFFFPHDLDLWLDLLNRPIGADAWHDHLEHVGNSGAETVRVLQLYTHPALKNPRRDGECYPWHWNF